MINRSVFLKNIAAQFEYTTLNELSYSKSFEEIDEWSSLVGLGILAMIRDEYNVRLYVKDLDSVKTIEDLFQLVNKKSEI